MLNDNDLSTTAMNRRYASPLLFLLVAPFAH